MKLLNMKKFLALIALVLSVVMVFAACAENEPTDTTTAAPNDETTTAAPDDGDTTTAEPEDDGTTTTAPENDGTTTTEPEDDGDENPDDTTTTAPEVGGDENPDDDTTTTAPEVGGDENPDDDTTTTAPEAGGDEPGDTVKFNVTFVDYNGDVISTQEVEIGGAAITPVFVPTRVGYDFIGWDVAYNSVTDDTTVTAQYVKIAASEKSFAISSDDQTPSTALPQTALGEFFNVQYDTNGSTPQIETNKMINLVGFSEMVTRPQGAYALDMGYASANINGEYKGFAAIIARGIRATCEGGRYYGADGGDTAGTSFGGAGIYYNGYFKVWDTAHNHAGTIWTIRLNVKTYENGAFVSNVYEIDVPFSQAGPYLAFRVEDNGTTVSLISGGKTLFTVTPEGTKDYAIEGVGAYDLAAKATVTVYDLNGNVTNTETLENACVGASVMNSDLALATRQGGILQFKTLTIAPLTPPAVQHTVTWVVDGQATTVQVADGATPEYAGTPSKAATAQYTYTFKGWDKEPVPAYGNVTYTAQFEETLRSYTVTFKNEDGSTLQSTEVEYGQMPGYDGTPVKAADDLNTYEFAGWTPALDLVTGEATYTATFTAVDKKHSDYVVNLPALGPAATISGWRSNAENPAGQYAIINSKNGDEIANRGGAFVIFEGNAMTITNVDLYKYKSMTIRIAAAQVLEDRLVIKVNGTEIKTFCPAYNTNNPDFFDYSNKNYGDNHILWDFVLPLEIDLVNATVTIESAGAPMAAAFFIADVSFAGDLIKNTPAEHTVTFVGKDGATLKTETVLTGKGATAPAAPEVEGYTFTGWDAEYATVNGDLTVNAIYEIKTYTVTFKDYDGEVIKTETLEHGAAIVAPADPTRESTVQHAYTFTGWDTEVAATATGDATYTATYEETLRSYTVTFLGFENAELKVETVQYGSAATAPEAPAVEGYKFEGWNKAFDEITGDLTVEALYTAESAEPTYKVTWNNEDGTLLELDVNLSEGDMPEYNGETPVKAADAQYTYTFKGWDKEISAVTGDVTYTATYDATLRSYTVTWDVNGTVTTETYEYGQTPEFKGETDRAADAQYTYTFAGWDAEIVAVTGNVTYTATFDKVANKYTVTWNVNGTITTETYEYGQNPEFKGSTAKAEDAQYTYTFKGWTPEVAAVTDNVTYTAQYDQTCKHVSYKNGKCTNCGAEDPTYITPAFLSTAAGNAKISNEVTSENGFDYIHMTFSTGKPQITLKGANAGADKNFNRYMLIRYRGNGSGYGSNYDFFLTVNGTEMIGGQKNKANWLNLNLNNEWHYIIVDLGTSDISSLNWTLLDGDTITATKGNWLDIEYVKFFGSYADAKAYEVATHPEGNIYPGIAENGSNGAITTVNAVASQVYYAHKDTNALYAGNKKLTANGKNLIMEKSYIEEGYHNIYVTVALSGTYDPANLGLQIGNGDVTWGVVVPAGGPYWVICNAASQLESGETKTLRILIKNTSATIPEESIILLDTFTITRQ